MIRHHGTAPWRAVVLHGGPGAPGSAEPLAAEAGKFVGTLEPMQTRDSVSGLLEELHGQLSESVREPAVLIGHSWGAWLALLYAARFPGLVARLVLVGSGPLDAAYVPRIAERRNSRLSKGQRREYALATAALASGAKNDEMDEALRTLQALTRKSDFYRAASRAEWAMRRALPVDARHHAMVWKEAARLRADGELLGAAAMTTARLTVLHGEDDPHPPEGVIEPLHRIGRIFEARVFTRCGHYPFLEEYAAKEFAAALGSCLA